MFLVLTHAATSCTGYVEVSIYGFTFNVIILESLGQCSCPDCLREMGKRRGEETGRCQVNISCKIGIFFDKKSCAVLL
jgi:hypothetical protein